MAKAVPRAPQRKPARPQRLDAELLAREWPSTGLCAEAQADGVPCPEPGRCCEHCAHAAERFLHRPL